MYVTGNWGNQVFPEMPVPLWKLLNCGTPLTYLLTVCCFPELGTSQIKYLSIFGKSKYFQAFPQIPDYCNFLHRE